MMGYETVVRDMVLACAEAAKKIVQTQAMTGHLEPMYLYYRKSTPKKHGDLILISDSAPVPFGYELATVEGLRSSVPYEKYFAWVHLRSARLPILAWEIT